MNRANLSQEFTGLYKDVYRGMGNAYVSYSKKHQDETYLINVVCLVTFSNPIYRFMFI